MRNKSNDLAMKKSENHGEKHRLGEGSRAEGTIHLQTVERVMSSNFILAENTVASSMGVEGSRGCQLGK